MIIVVMGLWYGAIRRDDIISASGCVAGYAVRMLWYALFSVSGSH